MIAASPRGTFYPWNRRLPTRYKWTGIRPSPRPFHTEDNSRQCVNVDEKYQSRYIRQKEVGTFRFVRTADPEREGKVILEFNDCLNRYIIFREDRFRELSSRVNIYAPSIFKKKKTIFKLISKFLIRIAIRPSISFPSQRRRRKKERNKQKYVIGRFFRSDSTNEREYSQKLVITSRCMMTHRYPKR